MKYDGLIMIIALITFVLTVIVTKKSIPILKQRRIGQMILEEGPSWHKSKEGTPTMGGICFIFAAFLVFVAVSVWLIKSRENKQLLALLNVFVYGLLNGLVGMIDDVAKIKKSENKGLSAKSKLMFQTVITVLFLVSTYFSVGIDTVINIPFLNVTFDLGIFYYVFVFLILCGTVNAVNLTDGLDGLASTCALSIGIFFVILYYTFINEVSLGIVGALLSGMTLGFLVFNLHPAKVFMGDTGSLFLGGLIASSSFIVGNPILVLIYGFVFILEALSVIAQVLYFKMSKGKRLLKMAPLHHHFEKKGYSEMKIVSIFGIINAIFCVIAFLTFVL